MISGWTILFCGLLFIALTWRVIQARQSSGVALGSGDDKILERRIRGQANAGEQMPLTILALMAAETMGGGGLLLAIFALIFCIGRLMHGICFGWMDHSPRLRVIGMATSISGSALILLYLAAVLVMGG